MGSHLRQGIRPVRLPRGFGSNGRSSAPRFRNPRTAQKHDFGLTKISDQTATCAAAFNFKPATLVRRRPEYVPLSPFPCLLHPHPHHPTQPMPRVLLPSACRDRPWRTRRTTAPRRTVSSAGFCGLFCGRLCMPWRSKLPWVDLSHAILHCCLSSPSVKVHHADQPCFDAVRYGCRRSD